MQQLVKHCERILKAEEILVDINNIPNVPHLRSALKIYISDGKLRKFLFKDINDLTKTLTGENVKNVSEFMFKQAELEVHRNTFLIDVSFVGGKFRK